MKCKITDELIIGVLKEHEAGLSAKELCRKYGMSDATFYKWKAKFSVMPYHPFLPLRLSWKTFPATEVKPSASLNSR